MYDVPTYMKIKFRDFWSGFQLATKIDWQSSFLALAIASKKIQNHQWNLLKVVAIWRSQWNSGFSYGGQNPWSSEETRTQEVVRSKPSVRYEVDWSFATFNCCKIVLMFEETEKRPGIAHFWKENIAWDFVG